MNIEVLYRNLQVDIFTFMSGRGCAERLESCIALRAKPGNVEIVHEGRHFNANSFLRTLGTSDQLDPQMAIYGNPRLMSTMMLMM